MAGFQGSLQEWRRYIDEKTRAVRDRQEGRGEETDSDLADSPADAASDEVEAILTKHKAIAEEINRPAPKVPAPVDPPMPVGPGPMPDPTVVEAAAMFSRLPRHIQLLMRPATEEVAQNSYKKEFSESREELIRRLLDPQLTLEETARILNVCPTTVRRYSNRGLLKQERTPGNHRRFRMSDVLSFLEQNSAKS